MNQHLGFSDNVCNIQRVGLKLYLWIIDPYLSRQEYPKVLVSANWHSYLGLYKQKN